MNACKTFAKKYPIVIVALTVLLVFALLKIRFLLIPDGPVAEGLREIFLAIVIFAWTFLFMGKEKVTPNAAGFKYGFRLLRGYFIIMVAFAVLMSVGTVVLEGVPANFAIKFLNGLLIGLTVGIVEEFSFRGLVFGGLLEKIGNSKKNIIMASILSGLLFGVMHIVYAALGGEITSLATVFTALLKTVQTGIFGVVLAFIYYTTKNIYVVAALHSLDDFIIFVFSAFKTEDGVGAGSYVSGSTTGMIVIYIIFTLIMVPALIKSIKDLKEDEAIPFDDDFKPIAVRFEKTSK